MICPNSRCGCIPHVLSTVASVLTFYISISHHIYSSLPDSSLLFPRFVPYPPALLYRATLQCTVVSLGLSVSFQRSQTVTLLALHDTHAPHCLCVVRLTHSHVESEVFKMLR